MASARSRIEHKHFRLDVAKIKRAQRLLKAGTQTETLDRALDVVIAEHERNRLTREANERFVNSRIEIIDVYGKVAVRGRLPRPQARDRRYSRRSPSKGCPLGTSQ